MPPIRLRLRLTPSFPRRFSSTSHRPFKIIPKCSPSTSPCACMPTLPTSYPIDHTRPLANTTPCYTTHIVIPTGQRDWPSRIEDSPATTPWGALTARLKRELGPRGGSYDPEHPVLVTTSSFNPESPRSDSPSTTPILLFPAGSHLSAPTTKLRKLLTSSGTTLHSPSIPTILICSHHTRDPRCGILGPLLLQEFIRQLPTFGFTPNSTFPSPDPSPDPPTVHVGCISHVGGHAWAGNVIIYTPLETANALAGTGVWYGRVEPRHVEGIIRETVVGGKVIGELWRGAAGHS